MMYGRRSIRRDGLSRYQLNQKSYDKSHSFAQGRGCMDEHRLHSVLPRGVARSAVAGSLHDGGTPCERSSNLGTLHGRHIRSWSRYLEHCRSICRGALRLSVQHDSKLEYARSQRRQRARSPHDVDDGALLRRASRYFYFPCISQVMPWTAARIRTRILPRRLWLPVRCTRARCILKCQK